MRLKPFQFLFILLFLQLFACDSNRWEIPDEAKGLKQEWKRFDLELLAVAEQGVEKLEVETLSHHFPNFFPLYLQGIMRFGPLGASETEATLKQFMSDREIKKLFLKTAEKYPQDELNNESNELAKAFDRYHYYFPRRVVPEVNTFVSAFTYSTVVDDSLLGIGLDTYLGSDYEVYAQAGIPKYKFKHFEREYMVSDALKAWLITEFESKGGQNLLEQMIFNGKIAYLMKAFLPETPEHIFINYDQEELNWCEENEEEIWFHFIEMELLHTIENHRIRKYMGDAPFIAGFPKGSPGRVGQWVGAQIVEAFMENNTQVSLQELMEMDNADQLLQKSKYKPKR